MPCLSHFNMRIQQRMDESHKGQPEEKADECKFIIKKEGQNEEWSQKAREGTHWWSERSDHFEEKRANGNE